MNTRTDTHSELIGYLLWIFGFTGSHRFYFGRPVTGTIWFFTLGLLGIGWLIDLFLIPWMERTAELRFYMGKWVTGIIYLLTGGLFLLGLLYDLWTLNSQVSELNRIKG